MVAIGLLLGGCFTETFQKGYSLPDGALEQIPIGSTQEQVLIVLGTPSTVATVSGSRRTREASSVMAAPFLPSGAQRSLG